MIGIVDSREWVGMGWNLGIPRASVFSGDAGILCSHRRECLVRIWGMFDSCANWFLFLGGLFRECW